jgi:Domain of unknown function (DUF1707)
VSDRSSLRVADADREQLADELREHLVAGRLTPEGGGGLGIAAICVAIWLADGASGSFWPIWVIVAVLLPLVRDGWRLLGPAPDLEAVEAHLSARRARRLAHERRHTHRRGLPR